MHIGSGWRSMTALRRSVCLAVGVVLVALSGQVAWAAPGDMTLVSRASGANGVKGDCGSYLPPRRGREHDDACQPRQRRGGGPGQPGLVRRVDFW